MSIEQFINIDWQTMLSSTILIISAYILCLPIGFNREKEASSAGIRTFPLIAVASCAFILLAQGMDDDFVLGRAVQAIITGLGFLGGGVILKKENKVDGMSTAVSIWVTGCIGLAVGLGRLEIAIILALGCYISLRYGKVNH